MAAESGSTKSELNTTSLGSIIQTQRPLVYILQSNHNKEHFFVCVENPRLFLRVYFELGGNPLGKGNKILKVGNHPVGLV